MQEVRTTGVEGSPKHPKARPGATTALLLAAVAVQLLGSCGAFVWHADLKTFVDDGLSVVTMEGFASDAGISIESVICSRTETAIRLMLTNPRSVQLSCSLSWEEDALYDVLPAASVLGPEEVALCFTPSVLAERRDLKLTVTLSAPAQNRTYAPEEITFHCNTPPGCVTASLDAALDQDGVAFVAFRLPCSDTDGDLGQVEIAWARADGAGAAQTVTLSVHDPSLLEEKRTPQGLDILGPDGPLDRYYQPSDLVSGDDYVFTVAVVDSEGLRSTTASITTDATRYGVSYDGNGNTTGEPPVDPAGYRQTKPVTVLGAGTLERTGYTFAGWNTVAGGGGTAYAPGDVFAMGAANAVLYAQWSINTYTLSFDSQGGSAVAPLEGDYDTTLVVPNGPERSGYTFTGWNTQADGLGTTYAPGDVFRVPDGNTTVYAQWSINSYAVTFDSQGGSAVGPHVVVYAEVVGRPADPTRTDYTFLGWYRETVCITPWDFDTDTMPPGDLVLYAGWVDNDSVVVDFTLNPAYGSIIFGPSTAGVVRGQELVLTPTLAGATGWHWYVDGVLVAGQTTGTFRWDTTGLQPGQYIVSVDAVYQGYACTGSIRVTVTY